MRFLMNASTGAATVSVRLAERPGGIVAHVTIDHAAKLNTLGHALMIEFVEKMEALAARDDLRAVVLTGAGPKAFIGGANIVEMAALNAEGAQAFITLVHRTCVSLRDLPVPVIARVNGYALGAGLEVAAACDLRIASSNAVFGMPEVKVGIPSVVEAALLPGLIGWGRTRELLLFGENIDAATALSWGLVEQVVAPPAPGAPGGARRRGPPPRLPAQPRPAGGPAAEEAHSPMGRHDPVAGGSRRHRKLHAGLRDPRAGAGGGGGLGGRRVGRE